MNERRTKCPTHGTVMFTHREQLVCAPCIIAAHGHLLPGMLWSAFLDSRCTELTAMMDWFVDPKDGQKAPEAL